MNENQNISYVATMPLALALVCAAANVDSEYVEHVILTSAESDVSVVSHWYDEPAQGSAYVIENYMSDSHIAGVDQRYKHVEASEAVAFKIGLTSMGLGVCAAATSFVIPLEVLISGSAVLTFFGAAIAASAVQAVQNGR